MGVDPGVVHIGSTIWVHPTRPGRLCDHPPTHTLYSLRSPIDNSSLGWLSKKVAVLIVFFAVAGATLCDLEKNCDLREGRSHFTRPRNCNLLCSMHYVYLYIFLSSSETFLPALLPSFCPSLLPSCLPSFFP